MIITDLKELEITDEEKKAAPPANPFEVALPYSPLISAQPLQDGNFRYIVIFNDVFVYNPSSILQLVDVLNNAKEGSVVEIYINTPGGSVYTLVMVLTAILNTKAKVVTIAEGIAASCGAMLWGYGHEVRITPNSIIMFHAPSHMDWDKTLNIKDRADAIIQRFKALMEPIVQRGLITEEQYLQMFDEKKDVYITADQYKKKESEEEGGE